MRSKMGFQWAGLGKTSMANIACEWAISVVGSHMFGNFGWVLQDFSAILAFVDCYRTLFLDVFLKENDVKSWGTTRFPVWNSAVPEVLSSS